MQNQISDVSSCVAGQVLFEKGQETNAIYIVREGSFKEWDVVGDQRVILEFKFPDEVLGLDSLESKRYTATAEALEDSVVEVIDMKSLLQSANFEFESHIIRLMSEHLLRKKVFYLAQKTGSADARLAAFLLCLLARQKPEKSEQGMVIHFPMSQRDVSKYLGLAVETVCRSFGRLQKLGVISLLERKIYLHDPDAIKRLSEIPLSMMQTVSIV